MNWFSMRNTTSYLYLVAIAILAITVKFFLAHASPEILRFLLWPPAKMVALCFSASYFWSGEQGYVFPELHMYIHKGCAAINFLVILFLSLSTLVIFCTTGKQRFVSFLWVLLLSYPLCLVVNTFRILLLVQTNVLNNRISFSMQETIHELLGGICFFGSLLFLLFLAEKILRFSFPSVQPFFPKN